MNQLDEPSEGIKRMNQANDSSKGTKQMYQADVPSKGIKQMNQADESNEWIKTEIKKWADESSGCEVKIGKNMDCNH